MTTCNQNVTFQDAEDGSGDLVVQFSPQFLAEQGWRVGDTLSVEVIGQSLVLSLIQDQAAQATPECDTPVARRSPCSVCDAPAGSESSGLPVATMVTNVQLKGLLYKVDLCEGCFFQALDNMRRDRMVQRMFYGDEDEERYSRETFGVVVHVDSWSRGGSQR